MLVGVVPVTSVVTILHQGDHPTATVRFSDGHSEPIAVEAIAMFIDERQNPGNRRHAAVVDVALPSPILRHGLCLVDTPGLGSVHAANTEATHAFIPRTDVALVVVGPDPPISGAELQLVEEVGREAGELLVVLNKADQSSPDHLREITDFTRTILEGALGRPIGRILEISALERLAQAQSTRVGGNWKPGSRGSLPAPGSALSRQQGSERCVVSHAGSLPIWHNGTTPYEGRLRRSRPE